MHSNQGAIIASITGHVLFVGLVIAVNHITFPRQELAPAPVYIKLSDFFPAASAESRVACRPVPQPRQHTPQNAHEPAPKKQIKIAGVRQKQLADKPAAVPETQSRTLASRQTKKILTVSAKTQPPHSPKAHSTTNNWPRPAEPGHTVQPQNGQARMATTPVAEQAPASRPQETSSVPPDKPTDNSASSVTPVADVSKAYFSENYSYIRDLIAGNIVFPPIARKLGWRGKLTVSFVLDQSGNASQIQIVESSGKELLDRNVMAAIRKTSPFPAPKHVVTLVLPVTYNLR